MSELLPQMLPKNRVLRALYICYYPVTEPLVQTQVVAYLEGLAKHGHSIHLLSFELPGLQKEQARQIRRELKAKGIIWHHLRYHKRPSVPATLFDVMCGVLKALRLKRRFGIQVIHARSHVPATMGLILKKLVGTSLIFDIRGLLAEEYVDIGNWKADSPQFRVTKSLEKKCIANADGLVVLTERVKNALFGPNSPFSGTPPAPLQVIPCCADLSQIEAQASQRDAMRQKWGLEGKTVMVYVGKFGGWYLQREMVEFFAAARQEIPNLHFLILTQSDPQLIRDEFARLEIGAEFWTLTQAPPAQVGSFLWASDFAVSFIAASPSKIASSPTKVGEYLAAGLPLVCNRGVGDMDSIVETHCVGVAFEEFSPDSYREVARAVVPLLGDEDAKNRCQKAARAVASLGDVGVPRYLALYEAVREGRERKRAKRG